MSKKQSSNENVEEEIGIRLFTIDSNDKQQTKGSTKSKAEIQKPQGQLSLGNSIAKPILEEKRRVMRRRVPPSEREFIWKSTNGLCYLCKTQLPKNSSWHIEHVVAFSRNPTQNDVLGNMLPACATCNLKKNDRELLELLQKDLTFDLATWSKDIGHLHTAARNELLYALDFKHSRQQKVQKEAIQAKQDEKNMITEDMIQRIVQEIEQKVTHDCLDFEASKTTSDDDNNTNNLPGYHILSKDLTFDFENALQIGFGGFGSVYLGSISSKTLQLQQEKTSNSTKSENDIIDCAIKIQDCSTKGSYEAFVRELEALCSLNHKIPHIVQFYGWVAIEGVNNKNRFGLVLEYCSHCLSDIRVAQAINPIAIFFQVAEALEGIHQLGFIHRDIKPNNILIHKANGQDWKSAEAKLCDFGCTKNIQTTKYEEHTKHAGTASFRPPEIRRGELVDKSDIYSMGKSMELLLTENTTLLNDRYYYELWKELCERMFHNKVIFRPNATQVKSILNNYMLIQTNKCSKDQAWAWDNRNCDVVLKATNRPVGVKIAIKEETPSISPMKASSTKSNSGFVGSKSKIKPSTTPSKASISPIDPLLTEEAIENSIVEPQTSAAEEEDVSEGKSEEPTPQLVKSSENNIIVWLSSKSACRENPKGNKEAAYHLFDDCMYVVKSAKKESIHEVSLKEALEFRHGCCKICEKKKPVSVDEIIKDIDMKLTI